MDCYKILSMFGLMTLIVFGLMPESSSANIMDPFGPKYSFFASYSSNGVAFYGSQINLKTGIDGLNLGLFYLGINRKSYSGIDLSFKKSWGNSDLFFNIIFLYPMVSKGIPAKGRFTGLGTEP